MKYLSLIAIVVFLQLSWWVSQQDKTLTVSQQNRLLSVIKEYMTQVVKEKEPAAAEIEFSNLQTETVEPGRTLKAHFKFSYLQTSPTGDQDRVFRKGHFLVTSSDGKDWKAQIDEINDVEVQFINPQPIEGDLTNPADPEDLKASESATSDVIEPAKETDPTH